MVDTFAPLQLAGAARECDDPDYPWTWAGGREPGRSAPGGRHHVVDHRAVDQG